MLLRVLSDSPELFYQIFAILSHVAFSFLNSLFLESNELFFVFSIRYDERHEIISRLFNFREFLLVLVKLSRRPADSLHASRRDAINEPRTARLKRTIRDHLVPRLPASALLAGRQREADGDDGRS